MMQYSHHKLKTHFSAASVSESSRQGGAVIIMVVSLLSTLVVLGLFFYSWTQQELTSSELFAAKEPLEIDPDPIFDVVLRQAIVGPRANEFQSALSGGHHSMLAHILGTPIVDGDNVYYQPHPYIGQGAMIRIDDSADGDGNPDLTWDIDGDMVNDVPGTFNVDYGGGTTLDQDNFVINFSRAANGGSMAGVGSQFNANAGYTYPDINSNFLAVDEIISNEGNSATYRLVMPSYFRPQLFTRRRFAAGGRGFGSYTDTTIDPMSAPSLDGVFEENSGQVSGVTVQTRNKVLRPHAGHLALNRSNGSTVSISGTPVRRFANSVTTAQSGDQNRIIQEFPFEVDVDNDSIPNEMGLFSTDDATDVDYEYDGDVDRDGIRDAILLDVGHDIIELPNGRQVVPLVMMKWIDNDGLLNVNAHGNMQRLVQDQTQINDSNEIPLSASNQGLSSFEVNLGLGLTADPMSAADIEQTAGVKDRVFVNHNGMYGFNPTSRQEASNAELLRLLTGSFVYDRYGGTVTKIDSSNPVVGRYGNVDNSAQVTAVETALSGGALRSGPPDWSSSSTIPLPGQTNADDDDENGTGEPLDIYQLFGHPLDHTGVGNASEVPMTGTNRGNRRRLVLEGTGVQIPRMAYDEGWVNSQLGSTLEPSPLNALTDEPDETLVEPATRTGADTPFEPAELFSLHASDADLAYSSIESRLLELASFNFRDSRQAAQIRRRFTTDSWDRLEFSHRPRQAGASRGWEFNEWTDSMGATFTRNNIDTPSGTASITYDRAFPPQFGDPSVNPGNIAVFQAADPFRASVRRLLTTRIETSPSTSTTPVWEALRSTGEVGQRLNLNRILTGFRSNGAPIFDRLTEHPDSLPATAPPTDPDETTARLDRQQLARDIYVLLYLLGGEKDGNEYTWTDPNNAMSMAGPGHSLEQMRDMAQFAVNIVDALDYDSITTRFEYDTNLSDGWNLDDDAYDDEGGDRDFVDGVEIQQVTLSEAMFVFSEGDMSESRTEWDDTRDHAFAYIELFNTGLVDLDWEEEWQIRLEVTPGMSSAHIRELTLDAGTIDRGGFFTIGSAKVETGGTALADSLMEIEDSSMNMQVVAPASGTLDLDLVVNTSGGMTTGFTLVDPTASRDMALPNGNDFFPDTVAADLEANGGDIRIILRKRANLTRTAPSPTYDPSNAAQQGEQDDNPWIEVDRMELQVAGGMSQDGFVDFNINQLGQVDSWERKEPFNRRSEVESVGGQTGGMNDPEIQNTLGQFNVDSSMTLNPSQFDLWQVHFDRDFSSVAELLSIPLYGPEDLTLKMGEHLGTTNSKLTGFYEDTTTSQLEPAVAGSLVLFPDPSLLTDPPTNWPNGNRWHRLFEFLSVNPQNIERLGDFNRGATAAIPFARRTPGKINLNMVRHESVLAGLIDDAMIDRFGDNPTNSATFDNGAGLNNRNWYRELLRTREPIDHFLYFRTGGTTGGAAVRIPGVPGSHPFMPGSYFDGFAESAIKAFTPFRANVAQFLQPITGHMDMTISNGSDNGDWQDLDLFEARASDDVGQDTVDYHTRHRIFAKVLNNSTNRSHVFSGWIEIVFHEAHVITDDSSGDEAVQIGAEAEDIPHFRLFCVVDLSRLEEAYDPNSNTFDFQKFIIHRQQLR